jgi:hypothetical protein
MCDRCIEFDRKIAHYERLASAISDQLTVDRIKMLIENLQAQKESLHREQ